MRFREKLADWISGGAISKREDDLDYWRKMCQIQSQKANNYGKALISIREYTATQKSGTARKVARMCEEALR